MSESEVAALIEHAGAWAASLSESKVPAHQNSCYYIKALVQAVQSVEAA